MLNRDTDCSMRSRRRLCFAFSTSDLTHSYHAHSFARALTQNDMLLHSLDSPFPSDDVGLSIMPIGIRQPVCNLWADVVWRSCMSVRDVCTDPVVFWCIVFGCPIWMKTFSLSWVNFGIPSVTLARHMLPECLPVYWSIHFLSLTC